MSIENLNVGANEQSSQHSAHHGHEIHFFLDGEPEETKSHELRASQIISDFGKKDPATNYLVRIEHGRKAESYQNKGETEIMLHEGMCFQIINTGPMTVSDGLPATGVGMFLKGLRELGYSPASLPDKPDHVIFDYRVQSGRFEGQQVRLGFVVPADFPFTLPTGPHVSPHIHPVNSGSGTHPAGGVHQDQARPFEAAGGHWQYWSRPFSGSKKTVAGYMAHIWRLWDSQ